MIEAISGLDKRTAAGVLARAALALEGEGNPAASATLDGEHALRLELIREVRNHLGVPLDDNRPETIERVGDFLDTASDELLGPPDTRSALERLSEHGTLASDLYNINIVPNIAAFHGKQFALEQQLIQRTIRTPDREQHYGPPMVPGDPFLVSLFYKNFWTPWPAKNFAMLIAAQREKLTLYVHQAWRLYAPLADARGIDLVDLLKRFADTYGFNVEIGGERGHFFLSTSEPLTSWARIGIRAPHPEVTFSYFSQINPFTKRPQSSLIVAIDLNRYRAMIKKMEVRGDQIR
jgi:hypothetical protein